MDNLHRIKTEVAHSLYTYLLNTRNAVTPDSPAHALEAEILHDLSKAVAGLVLPQFDNQLKAWADIDQASTNAKGLIAAQYQAQKEAMAQEPVPASAEEDAFNTVPEQENSIPQEQE